MQPTIGFPLSPINYPCSAVFYSAIYSATTSSSLHETGRGTFTSYSATLGLYRLSGLDSAVDYRFSVFMLQATALILQPNRVQLLILSSVPLSHCIIRVLELCSNMNFQLYQIKPSHYSCPWPVVNHQSSAQSHQATNLIMCLSCVEPTRIRDRHLADHTLGVRHNKIPLMHVIFWLVCGSWFQTPSAYRRTKHQNYSVLFLLNDQWILWNIYKVTRFPLESLTFTIILNRSQTHYQFKPTFDTLVLSYPAILSRNFQSSFKQSQHASSKCDICSFY